ncbi:aldehyde dehydrogenase family 3 member H1-like [Actinidia eriantha]|uniref:aldehyde dehydrogenase family 3 member H1-like n=1 Tax=Actinidia eriantha TaxID=165200 RepID=UPI00258A0359|nr:aldehyde dehydrogenase family 3 member H1-like [Actinidia eriantha]
MEEFHFNVIRAIAAGNAVVLKPSAAATSLLLAKLLEYVDNTAIRVVEGAVAETSALLEQKWDTIFYTGSGRIGRIIESAAAKHLTPLILELGGKCPAVVDSDINIEVRNSIYHTPGAMVAVRRIIAGKWGCNSGLACIAPDYLIIPKSFAPKLLRSLITEHSVSLCSLHLLIFVFLVDRCAKIRILERIRWNQKTYLEL